jgi:Prealbumin-like fold domain
MRRTFVHNGRRARGLRRRLTAAAASLGFAVGLLVAVSPPAGAVHDAGLFELDGNGFAAADGATTALQGTDWSCLFPNLPGSTTNCNASAPVPVTKIFSTDPLNSGSDDILSSSKDIQDLPAWTVVSQSAPDKDDIEHAMYATYDNGGQAITYFALDRYANTGSAFLGFWFFKGQVTQAGGKYVGAHVPGDILVLADNAGPVGQTTQMSVFSWDPTCTSGNVAGCADTNLRLVLGRGAVDCSNSVLDNLCATFNAVPTPSPWPFDPKSGPANTWDNSEFIEGGINLTALLKGDDCFTSVQAESRAAQSTDAELKDVVLSTINTCGTINIVKDAVPNDSADFTFTATGLTPSTFALDDDADATLSNTQKLLDVKPGTYNISENDPGADWSLTGLVCDNGSTVNTATRTASVTVKRGETVTCTYTNTKHTKLRLRKIVTNDNGGTATDQDFTLSADGTGTNDLTGTTPVDGLSMMPDTWALSETGVTGYAAGTWVCDGGTQNGSNITLSAGQEATCTITNDDIAPVLHLRKVLPNNSGGTATVADFPLTADGTGTNDLTGTSPVDSGSTLKADTWTLSEIAKTGYTASAWVCDKGVQNGTKITLGVGEEATCTITNDDQPAHLKLVKTVINDNGGTKVAGDFMLSATLTGAGNPTLAGAGGAESDVNAGTYTLSETNLPGYAAGNWSCSGAGTQNGTSLTLGLGQSEVCTIINNDIQPKLTVTKIVTNDNGGTKVVADFSLFVNATKVTSGVQGGFDAGSYTVSETNLPGYAASAWSGDCAPGGAVTLAPGDVKSCTITNDDTAGHLKLVKKVVNDAGGTAVDTDFTLSANGPTPISGKGGADGDVSAGSYTLSETTLVGYKAGSWSCVGGTLAADTLTLALAESATCTIINDDIAPTLTLKKIVVNDNGGTATTSAFKLTADGPSLLFGDGGASASVKAGTYALSETALTGYKASDWVCAGAGGTQNGANVTLALAANVTCTITNDDIQPKLTVIKTVINDNGGTKVVADFPLSVSGTSVTSGTPRGFNAATYTVSETSSYGYTASAWGGDCAANGSITLSVGDVKTCTITNDDQPGTLVIKKITKPVGTGSFAFATTGTGYNGFTLPGGGTNSQSLNAGSYTVTESSQLGWVITGIGGSTDPLTPYNCMVTGAGGSTGVGDLNTLGVAVSLKNGDTVTCLFENTATQGGVTRTQGFWATHTPLANAAWFGGTSFGHTFPGVAGTVGDASLCGRQILTLSALMGGFWADISKTSTGAKRSAVDQARMTLLQQLLAAELNASAFGSVPSTGSIAAWETAFCGTDITAIKTAQAQAAAFNTSGDSAAFTPGTSADSKNARLIAQKTFWDKLPAG